jgi:hypothetical protein
MPITRRNEKAEHSANSAFVHHSPSQTDDLNKVLTGRMKYTDRVHKGDSILASE